MSLESVLSAPTPFLLDLFKPANVRREGKAISDGYGVPEDSYGVPEDSYGVPSEKPVSYEASTSTLSPCSSYEPPSTTAAPSYSAPRHQQQPAFPDILGFIGNILKPKESAGQKYGCLSAPESDSYKAPEESYGVPEADAYKAPETDSYEAPESEAYEAPESTGYEAPQSDSYKAPEPISYEAPQSDSYDAPADNNNGSQDSIAVNERVNAALEE